MKIPAKIERALEATGLPWHLERGKGHLKIRLRDRLVGVMGTSKQSGSYSADDNIAAQIRRAAKEMHR